MVLDENGYLEEYHRIDETDSAKGTKWYAFLEVHQPSSWYNDQTYLDTLSKEAVSKFVEVTHEKYKATIGEHFDGVVPAIFTDEPQFTRKKVLGNSFDTQEDIMMPWTDKAEEFYAFLREIGKLAKEKGMQFCFHNHDGDLRPMGDTTALDLIYDNVDADLLQTELDLCWVYSAGIDPVIYINRYKDRARIIHCKDSNGRFREVYYKWHGGDYEQIKKTLGEMEFRPVGHGMLSYPAIMKAIDNTDIEWLIVEQDRPNGGMTSLECAQKSVESLKSF